MSGYLGKSWDRCGYYYLPCENLEEHDVEINDSWSIANQDHQKNETRSPNDVPPGHASKPYSARFKEQFMQLRNVINDMQGIKELLSFQPTGYSETVKEYFHIQNTSEFQQKLALLCAHLQEGFELEKIFLLVRFDKPRRFEVMTEVLGKLNRRLKRKGRQILLFMDNAPCHPQSLTGQFSNINVTLLPKNTTSKTQPLDAGIIASWKVKYKRRLLRHVCGQVDGVKNTTEIVKSINVLMAIEWGRQAWDKEVL